MRSFPLFIIFSSILILFPLGIQCLAFDTLANQLSTNHTTNITTNLIEPFHCTDSFDCNYHGFCSRNGTQCICDSNYATFGCDSNSQCCYQKEKRVKMFLLSFFVAWTGAPYFILGEIGLGVGILLLCCCGSCLGGGSAYNKNDDKNIWGVIGALAVSSALIWAFATWIMFAAETEPWNDKNGIPVGSW